MDSFLIWYYPVASRDFNFNCAWQCWNIIPSSSKNQCYFQTVSIIWLKLKNKLCIAFLIFLLLQFSTQRPRSTYLRKCNLKCRRNNNKCIPCSLPISLFAYSTHTYWQKWPNNCSWPATTEPDPVVCGVSRDQKFCFKKRIYWF